MMKVNLKIIAIALISTFLGACGGGGIDTAKNNSNSEGGAGAIASNGGDGITGTGITTGITAGRVTGFGSIYVNGIKFDVDNASFSRDGVASTGQSEFSIGEYVVIKGSVNGTTGVASEVIFEDLLEGVVTAASTNNVTIKVLGQQVETDANTRLIDDREGVAAGATFPHLTDLVVGNIVEVSGVKDVNGLIKATSVKLKEDSFVAGESENEVKGTVSSLNASGKTFMLGMILVDYSGANFEDFNMQGLVNGQYVEAKSHSDITGNTLVASKVKLKDEYLSVETGNEVEIEGLVTRFVSLQDFDVNGIAVTTHSGTVYEDGEATDISLNTKVELKGKVNSNNVLVAEKIEFDD